MANKTRTDIIAQLKEYVPALEASDHDAAVDNLIDISAELVSARNNFSYLNVSEPATHDITADEYTVAEGDFSMTSFKEIRMFEWIKAATGENSRIKYLPIREFHDRFRYISYSGNTPGKPTFYTRQGNSLLFNCQVDETITARIWYSKYHGNFANDSASHLFQPDNIGFQAIICTALTELRRLIPGVEVPQQALAAAQFAEYWIERLIEEDIGKSDEGVKIAPADKKENYSSTSDPYDWV